MENYTTTPYTPPKSKSKNKLKLFGAEIGFSQTHEPESEYYAEDDQMSLDSSSTASGSPDEKKKKKKKYECKWCFKVLANSQALGGHQNAHKKERMMKKIQLQASQAAGLGYYVDQDYSYSYDDHRQISFGNGDDQFFGGSDVTFQGEEHVHGFSLTHMDNMSSTSNYHHLDLQLGLGL